jgi:pyrimidine-specific ribonucleoside hydrolase
MTSRRSPAVARNLQPGVAGVAARLAGLAFAGSLVAACGAATPASPAASVAQASSHATPAPSVAAGDRIPVLIDTDLGGDDVTALLVLAHEPRVDLRAVTVSGTGIVHCPVGADVTRRILAAVGVTGIPVACGRETAGEGGREFPPDWRAGADAGFGMDLPDAPADPSTPDAATVISDVAAGTGGDLVIVALGPWTNLQDALAADPELATNVDRIHAMFGAVNVPGNIDHEGTTPADGVEWNAGADPASIPPVLASGIPITLVPLDATDHVPTPGDIVSRIGDRSTPAAGVARQLYERNPFLAGEGVYLWDTLASLALTNPGLATWSDLALGVKLEGTQAGRLVEDPAGTLATVATEADGEQTVAAFLAALER